MNSLDGKGSADDPTYVHINDGISNNFGNPGHKAVFTASPGPGGSNTKWPWAKALTIVVCMAWTAVSSSAILINKHIMVDLHFPYPVTVAFMGLLTTTIASYIAVQLLIEPHKRQFITQRHYFNRVLPTGFCMALTFQTGNMAYLYLTVAFVQMLKAVCPVITMLLLFLFKLERATTKLIVAVVVISAGVSIASYGELNMSLFGLASMLTSVVAESVRLVLTQHLLVGTSQILHPFEGLMYVGSACTLCLAIQALIWESSRILDEAAYLTAVKYPLHFGLAAVAGFGVNALAILVIKLASSLTLKVLGTVKDAALVTFGVIFLHEQVSGLQLSGYLVSLGGFIAYNVIKAGEVSNPKTILPSHKTA